MGSEPEQHESDASNNDPPSTSLELNIETYQAMICLLRGTHGLDSIDDGISVLRRTNPEVAAFILEIDPESKREMLISSLGDELETVRAIQTIECLRNAPPSPTPSTPPPAPPQPTTFFCHICQDEDPMNDLFVVSKCSHSYCREEIRKYIVMKIVQDHVVTPLCPACMEPTLAESEIMMVLSPDEQQVFHNLSLQVGVGSSPDMHECLVEGCRGAVVLDQGNTRFQCPIDACRAERCVTCNTRVWHNDQTCEQFQQQCRDNNLQPEQLRQLFMGTTYMCARCNFGPIEHIECDNLRTHHGDKNGTGTIDNSCPQCGWRSDTIEDWVKWDGRTWGERNGQSGGARDTIASSYSDSEDGGW